MNSRIVIRSPKSKGALLKIKDFGYNCLLYKKICSCFPSLKLLLITDPKLLFLLYLFISWWNDIVYDHRATTTGRCV